MPKGNCVFNRLWLEQAEYRSWIEECKGDRFSAYCKLCKKQFEVKATGESAVKKHSTGKKHLELEKACKPTVSLSTSILHIVVQLHCYHGILYWTFPTMTVDFIFSRHLWWIRLHSGTSDNHQEWRIHARYVCFCVVFGAIVLNTPTKMPKIPLQNPSKTLLFCYGKSAGTLGSVTCCCCYLMLQYSVFQCYFNII